MSTTMRLSTGICCVLVLALSLSHERMNAWAAPIDDAAPLPLEDFATEEQNDASDGQTEPLPVGGEAAAIVKAAKAAFAEGDLDLCRDKLRAAYAKSPNLPPPKLMLARLMLSGGQIARGRQLLEAAAQSHPQHPQVYLLFGQLALADGHATDAALHFEKALALEPPGNWTDAQQAYLQRACLQGKTRVAELRGDWDAAARLYQQQVDTRPKDAALRDRFAMALFRAGELDRAFEQFDLSYLQDPAMNPPEVSMAVMHVRAGDFDEADGWFEKALEKHPDDPAVHFEKSIALLYQDRAAEAAESAARAAELGMRAPLLSMHRGLIALQQGDAAAAEKHFEAVLDQSPENAGAMAHLALVLIEQKDEAKRARAAELAEAAFELRPNSPEAAAVLGWVNYRTGKAEAGERLLSAAAQSSADPLPLFLYGRLLVLEDRQEALQQAAEQLRRRLARPGLFALRPAARRWLDRVQPMGE